MTTNYLFIRLPYSAITLPYWKITMGYVLVGLSGRFYVGFSSLTELS